MSYNIQYYSLLKLNSVDILGVMDNGGCQQQHQRRKKIDPESRDFHCKCGKSYLSYAAAYTHVRLKHSGKAEYFKQISKPNRQQLKRGRPKEKKKIQINSETQKLSVIEQAILQIYESLGSQKIILQGNQLVTLDELLETYLQLQGEMGEPGLSLHIYHDQYGEVGKRISQFMYNLNKHFIPKISAKIIWFLNFLLTDNIRFVNQQFSINVEKARKKIVSENSICKKIWDGKDDLSNYILDTLEKYMNVVEKSIENDHQNQ